MPGLFQDKSINWVLKAVSLSYLAVTCYLFSGYFSEGFKGFILGDLLINYFCGFVRRGLFGSLVTGIANTLNIALLPLINGVVFCGYLLLAAFLLIKLWQKPLLLCLACCSPFGILFLGNDWGGVGRKEIFLLCLFIAALFALERLSGKRQIAILAIIILTGILIHEMYLLLSLPWLVWAFSISRHQSNDNKYRAPAFLSWLPAGYGFYLFAAGIFGLSVFFFAKSKAEKVACLQKQFAGIAVQNPGMNARLASVDSAVQWLEKDLAFAANKTAVIYQHTETRAYWWPRLLLFAITIGIAAFYVAGNAGYPLFKLQGWHLLAIFLGLLIQLWAALDWGRFLHTFYMHAMVMAAWVPFSAQQWPKSKYRFFAIGVLVFVLASSFVMIPHIYAGGEQRTFFMQAQGNRMLQFVQGLFN